MFCFIAYLGMWQELKDKREDLVETMLGQLAREYASGGMAQIRADFSPGPAGREPSTADRSPFFVRVATAGVPDAFVVLPRRSGGFDPAQGALLPATQDSIAWQETPA